MQKRVTRDLTHWLKFDDFFFFSFKHLPMHINEFNYNPKDLCVVVKVLLSCAKSTVHGINIRHPDCLNHRRCRHLGMNDDVDHLALSVEQFNSTSREEK